MNELAGGAGSFVPRGLTAGLLLLTTVDAVGLIGGSRRSGWLRLAEGAVVSEPLTRLS